MAEQQSQGGRVCEADVSQKVPFQLSERLAGMRVNDHNESSGSEAIPGK